MKIHHSILSKAVSLAVLVSITGCHANIKMAEQSQDEASKKFRAPSSNKAGIYIYRRDRFFIDASDRSPYLAVDDVKIGMTRPSTFYHIEVARGKHTISTESTFGYNELKLNAEGGKNYYFRQYLKPGPGKVGSELEAQTETEGKEGVLDCKEGLVLKN